LAKVKRSNWLVLSQAGPSAFLPFRVSPVRQMIALSVLALALVVGRPAWAVDADCLWDHVPADQRQNWLDAYQSSLHSAYLLALAEPLQIELSKVCEVPLIQEPVIRPLLVARILEIGAGAYWSQRVGRAFALESAWYDLSEEDRDRLRIWSVSAISDGRGEELYSDVIPRLAAAIGLDKPEDQASQQITAFVIGRAYREIISE